MNGILFKNKFILLLICFTLLATARFMYPTPAAALSWADAGSTIDPQSSVRSLLYEDNTLFAICGSAVYYNNDPRGGGVWKSAGKPGDQYMVSLAHDGTNLCVGTDAGVWRYDLGTGTWASVGSFGGLSISSLAFDSTNLYAGCYDGKIYYTPNPVGSGSWNPLPTPWPSTRDFAVVAISSDGTNLYAQLQDGTVYYNPDPMGGGSWNSVGDPYGIYGVGSGIISDGTRLFALCEHQIYYKQMPAGKGAWNRLDNPGDAAVDSIASDGTNLYVGGDAGKVSWSKFTYTYYFAEGYTGAGFQEYICIGNPGDKAASVTITYRFSDGGSKNQPVEVPAKSRATVNVNNAVGPDCEVSAVVSSESFILAERPMYFNYQGKWDDGHDVVGATAATNNWYFAEGYTGAGFDEWICVLNPGPEESNLEFSFQTQDQRGGTRKTGSVPPYSRKSFKVNELLGNGYQNSLQLYGDQPIVAERAMYFDYTGTKKWHWKGGHCVMGTTTFSNTFYFAEGTTRPGFEEWLTLANLNGEDLVVQATYQLGQGQGGPIQKSYTVTGHTRYTIFVPSEVGTDKDVSVLLTARSFFLAERPMYFNYHYKGLSATGGDCVSGSISYANDWLLAEGCTLSGFDEWLCMQNPSDTDATVEISYYTQEAGLLPVKTEIIPANTRKTIMVNENAGQGFQLSTGIRVTSGLGIVVERPMYFNFSGLNGGHVVMGFSQ